MKKFFSVLIAAFLLCLAGCDPNVSTDTSDLHGCSYVEVDKTAFISALGNGLGAYSEKLSNNGYLAETIDYSEYSFIYGLMTDNGNRPNVTELSENRVKSLARTYGATDSEINAIVNNLRTSKNVCLARVNGSKVTVYLF